MAVRKVDRPSPAASLLPLRGKQREEPSFGGVKLVHQREGTIVFAVPSLLERHEHELRLPHFDVVHHSSPKNRLISLLSGSENNNIGQFLAMHWRLDSTISCA